jgi:hypothetical protein
LVSSGLERLKYAIPYVSLASFQLSREVEQEWLCILTLKVHLGQKD